MAERTIYILLTRSGTWFSRLIHFATQDRYTHASIGLDGPDGPFYSFARKYRHLALPAGLVEEQALIDALTQRKIGGAALDVFHQEPLPEGHPFYTLENVTLTAHLAGTSADIFDVSYRMMRDTITSYLESGTWSHVVNMRQG